MLNVLYVDDNAEYRALINTFLTKKLKISLHLAASAEEAIELLQSTRFALAVCDYRMRAANGDAVFNFITQNALPTRFVLFTALSFDSDLRSKFVGPAFEGFVEHKNLEDLVQKIVLILGRAARE